MIILVFAIWYNKTMVLRRKSKPRGRVFIISGPTKAGKTTIIKRLRRRFPDLDTGLTYTTRRKRPGVVEDKVMKYVSREVFSRLRRQRKFLEWAVVHGELYGTSAEYVHRALAKGQHLLLHLDVQGAMKVKRHFPQAVMIFVKPENRTVIVRRLKRSRGMTEQEITRRLASYDKEMPYAKRYQYVILNRTGQLAHSTQRIAAILKKHW